MSSFQILECYKVYNKQGKRIRKNHKNWQETHGYRPDDRDPPNSIIKLSKAIDDFHAPNSDSDRLFPFLSAHTRNTEQQTDERTTGIDKNLMEVDRNPRNRIIKFLSKAIDDVCTSNSDPDRPFPFQLTNTIHVKQQTDERSTWISKKKACNSARKCREIHKPSVRGIIV